VPTVLAKNNDLVCVVPAREHNQHPVALFNRSSKVRIEKQEYSRNVVYFLGACMVQSTWGDNIHLPGVKQSMHSAVTQ
jgi:hypothetical protein